MPDENPYVVIFSLATGFAMPFILMILAVIFWDGPSSLAWWNKKHPPPKVEQDVAEWPIKDGRYR